MGCFWILVYYHSTLKQLILSYWVDRKHDKSCIAKLVIKILTLHMALGDLSPVAASLNMIRDFIYPQFIAYLLCVSHARPYLVRKAIQWALKGD